MLEKPSLMTRIIVGKTTGFVIGLIGLIALPLFVPDATWMLRIAAVLWYTTLGAIIAVFGVFNSHPMLKLPLPWWVRAPSVGAWMNLLAALFAYDRFGSLIETASGGMLSSPYWFVLEGAVVGYLIGLLATKFGGEGPETAGH